VGDQGDDVDQRMKMDLVELDVLVNNKKRRNKIFLLFFILL